MVFGEAEWLTAKLIRCQLDVNLYGSMLVYRHTSHLLRKSGMKGHFPRMVITNSHCSIQPLPGLATYAATKCALVGWEEALRMEICKYGISVVRFIPGSLVLNTKILSNQNIYSEEMQNKLSPEQQQFYGEYFNSYMNYLSKISAISSGKLTDKVLMEKFIATLVDKDPLFVYKHEPLRYKVYHFIFGITPFQIRKRIVSKFLAMPTYSKNTKNSM